LPNDIAGEKSEASAPPSSEAQQPGNPTTNTDDSEWISIPYDPDEHGFRRIVRNFTPSYVSPTARDPMIRLSLSLIRCAIAYAGGS
jgi:hypothetical protein